MHLAETENQIGRLKQVFQMLSQSPEEVDSPAIDGIIKEADEISDEIADKEVLDAALIASAQAIEHYEIARYGTLVAWAEQLSYQGCVSLLQQTLGEEKAADKNLTAIAKSRVNPRAAKAHEHT